MKILRKYANVIIPAAIVLGNFVAGILLAETILTILA